MGTFYLASCIIVDDQGRLLLLHRNRKGLMQWEIPGGKIEPGEDPRDTLLREAKEELGVDVTIVAELGDKHVTEEIPAGTFTNHFRWYRAAIKDGKPTNAEPEVHDDIGYFALDELRQGELTVSAAVRDFLIELDTSRISLD